eukprot:1620208-Rhodomonas_salina.1
MAIASSRGKMESFDLADSAWKRDWKKVDDLLEKGFSPDSRDSSDRERPILQIAAYYSNQRLVQKLLDLGAKIDLVDNTGATPLRIAVENANEATVALLLKNWAHPDWADKVGMSPLYFAVDAGKVEVVKLLLEKKADVDLADKLEYTPLFRAT